MENRKRFGIKKDSDKKTFRPRPEATNSADFVFGVQSVLELLKSEKDIEKILVQKDFAHPELEILARGKRAIIQKVPVEKLNSITRKNHQGVIAFASPINYATLSNVIANSYESGRAPLVILLDRLTDVRNFGAIARTAEACGVDALVVPTKGAAQINADAMKTSSGALSHIAVCRESDLAKTVTMLQESGFRVFACTEKAADDYYKSDFVGPVAIVMGSEQDGVSEPIMRICDELVKIPMLGQVGSLNVSVAAGVMMYEVLRQRMS